VDAQVIIWQTKPSSNFCYFTKETRTMCKFIWKAGAAGNFFEVHLGESFEQTVKQSRNARNGRRNTAGLVQTVLVPIRKCFTRSHLKIRWVCSL